MVRALSEYKLFKASNIYVIALFDIKKELVGTAVDIKGIKVPIFHVDELKKYLADYPNIKIALLTVPESSAQETLNILVTLGIKGIVNFAPKILKLPENARNVQLINDCIGASLYKVVYQINRRK